MKPVQKKKKQKKSKCNDGVNKNALLKLDKTILIKRLKSHKLSTNGTKNDLAERLYKHLINKKKKNKCTYGKSKKKKGTFSLGTKNKETESKNDNGDGTGRFSDRDSATDSATDCATDSATDSDIDLTFIEKDDEIIFRSYEGYEKYMNNFTNIDINKYLMISGYAKEIFNDTNEYIPSVIIQSIYKYYHIHPRYIMYPKIMIESDKYNDERDLLESFLNLVNPRVNWKIIEFLSKEPITELLLSFLSIPKNNVILNWPKNKLYDESEMTLNENLNELEFSNERNWSRSLTKILINNDGQETIKSFQLRLMDQIIFHGLCAYYPDTGGYRTYGRSVLVKLYQIWPKSFFGVMCDKENNNIQCLLHGILYNDMIHYNTIDALFKYIICMKFEDIGFRTKNFRIMRSKFIEQLMEIDIEGMKECVDTIMGESELYVNPPDCNV